MLRGFPWLIGLITVIAAAACGSAAAVTTSQQGRIYRDAAGWTIEVPPGWHALRFSDFKDGVRAAGVQLSNVKLPPPTLVPGAPIQVSGVLPARGVGLVIATDTDPKVPHDGPLAVLPLRGPDAPDGWKNWTGNSCSGPGPGASPGAGCLDMESLWFRWHGTTFIVNAKIGPKAYHGDQTAVDAIIPSLR
jgi:hypothetical protein